MTDPTEITIESILRPCCSKLELVLEAILPEQTTTPTELHAAIRYSTLNAGKRLRACLVYLTGEMLGAEESQLDAAAVAVELIHAYSLVHDDLPCMDDDDLRRGKASCHKAYGVATAMLVGDALQSLAFEVLANAHKENADRGNRLIMTLARASGSLGMAGGQALDLEAEGKAILLPALQQIHAMKTAALIKASVVMGAQAADLTNIDHLQYLSTYASALGLSFQIQDDILDVTSDTTTLGKQTGADEDKDKATYPALMGLDAAIEAATSAHQQAITALQALPYDTHKLQLLSEYAINRVH